MRDTPPAPTLEPGPLVVALREMLGARLVAYLAGTDDTRIVARWADGTSESPSDVEDRLQLAYQVAAIVSGPVPPRLAQTWFQGMNPQLGDRSPARVIRQTDPSESGPALLAAARAFAERG